MAKTIENLFRNLHLGSNVVVILLFLVFFKNIRKERSLFLVLAYVFSDGLLNYLSFYLSASTNLYISAFYTFFEYSLFSAFIYFNIEKKAFKKAIIFISIPFIVFTSAYDVLTNFHYIDSIPIGIETLLILLYSFYYLYEQTNDTTNLFIYNRYQFFVIIGMMIYLAGSFFVYIFASQLSKSVLTQYWFLTNVFYTLMNLLFIIAIIIFRRNSRKPDPYTGKFHPYLN